MGLGKHERRGGKATIYCRGMMVYPVLKQAILTTQQWWVKGKYKSIQFKNNPGWISTEFRTIYTEIILPKPTAYPLLISVFPNSPVILTTLNCRYCSPKLWIWRDALSKFRYMPNKYRTENVTFTVRSIIKIKVCIL